MKKLIAISVMFALIAGAAFAVDLGGDVIASTQLFSASGGDDPVFLTGNLGRIRIEGSGEGDVGIGTVGGWIRFDGLFAPLIEQGDITDKSWEHQLVWSAVSHALAWYQPIDAVKIQVGVNTDGHYDTSHIGRYGFYAQMNEIGGVNSNGNWGDTSFDSGVFGGYSDLHFALIITPMDALTVNIAIPLNAAPSGDDKQMAAAFKSSLFQVNYSADFGAIHVTYQGINDAALSGKIFASVYLSMIENLGLELGVGYGLKAEGATNPPVGIALGAAYNAGAFGVKLRGIVEVPMESGQDLLFRVDVIPSYAVNDNVTIYGDIGVYQKVDLTFHIAPYVRIGAEWGTSFYVGFYFNNGDGVKLDDPNWGIPLGIIAKF
jgi:opacity protein-like surface antigen